MLFCKQVNKWIKNNVLIAYIQSFGQILESFLCKNNYAYWITNWARKMSETSKKYLKTNFLWSKSLCLLGKIKKRECQGIPLHLRAMNILSIFLIFFIFPSILNWKTRNWRQICSTVMAMILNLKAVFLQSQECYPGWSWHWYISLRFSVHLFDLGSALWTECVPSKFICWSLKAQCSYIWR